MLIDFKTDQPEIYTISLAFRKSCNKQSKTSEISLPLLNLHFSNIAGRQ